MLRAGAYRADALGSQLEDACFRFAENPSRVVVDAATRTVKVSEVLEWHRAQVETEAGSLVAFLSRYVPAEAMDALRAPGKPWKVTFIPLQWALNGR